jgi:hypothetical protein
MKRKIHIAIPQSLSPLRGSDMIYTLCSQKRGMLDTKNVFFYFIDQYSLAGLTCKTCQKIVRDINPESWEDAWRDAQDGYFA